MTCPHSLTTEARNTPVSSRTLLTPRLKGMVLLLLAILVWGANWPVMKAGLGHVTPVWFSASRFALGALCLFLLQLLTGTLYRPSRGDVPLLLSVGLLQMLAFTLLGALAMTDIPAGRSAVLAYTTPLWVTPLAVLVFRERLVPRQLLGAALGMFGVAVLFNPLALDWHNANLVRANLMLLIASACWALCILHLRYAKVRATAYQLAPWQMLVATAPLLALARIVEGPFTGDGSVAFWQIILFVGPLATAFCFCAVNAASMWLPATSMSLAMLGVPLVGLMSSVFWLGETLSASLIAGVLAISAGILLAIVKTRAKATS
ncbi:MULTISPECIES: DMT family transporter [Stutzerimonas]|uniref:DMT family transporter n=1 Tax=Stutzerimonas TaxID=2901164 RepID=UPI0015E44246|nr:MULTISPECIES: DMT family transporter [Stutzerimonas]MBA1186725.1 DMT family transporter [Stutzerimonas stutzeri]UVO17482.1 DMT family transporter [Stutzerimonas stutzeri]